MRIAVDQERLGHVGAPARPEVAIWQDVEWGHYRADLAVWESLAPPGSRVLELGCGTGRVSWFLAESGRQVSAVDAERGLVTDLRQRAKAACLSIKTAQADATALRLGRQFDVILAPLQLVNIIEPVARVALLRSAAAHLAPGGKLAMSLVAPGDVHHALSAAPPMQDRGAAADDAELSNRRLDGVAADADEPTRQRSDGVAVDAGHSSGRRFDGVAISARESGGWSLEGALPDMGELEGWVYASQPLSAELDGQCLDVCRRREVVSPTGERRESVHRDRFHLVEPGLIENDAWALGLTPLARQRVPATDLDGATTILIVQAAGDADESCGGQA